MSRFALPNDNNKDSIRFNGCMIIYSDELTRRHARMMASSLYTRDERFFNFSVNTIDWPPGVSLNQDCPLETSPCGIEIMSTLAANYAEQSFTSLASLNSHHLEYYNPTVVHGPAQYMKPDTSIGNFRSHGLNQQSNPIYYNGSHVMSMTSELYSDFTCDEVNLLYNFTTTKRSHIVSPTCFSDYLSFYCDSYHDGSQEKQDSVPSHPPDVDTISSISNSGVKSEKNSQNKPRDRLRCPSPGCPQTLKRIDSVRRHYICCHTPIRPYCCDHPDCARSFPRSDYLLKHKRRHPSKSQQGQV